MPTSNEGRKEDLVRYRKHAKNLYVKSYGLKNRHGLDLMMTQRGHGLGNQMATKERLSLNS